MDLDLLIAEIGSTTTVVNGFTGIKKGTPRLKGQGLAPTTVLEGDVTVGLNNAIENLKEVLGADDLTWSEFMATSSAAGGLKMTVHGLVKDMTVKAAREAALGAGAVIKMVTAGKLRESKLNKIKEINPNIILLAGGVDYGEEEVILHNARLLAQMKLNVPIIYAGNKAIQDEVRDIFDNSQQDILITDNVYPEIDTLNIEPTRRLIQQVFARHIIKAPGMEKIKPMLSSEMMPTPGAVMKSARLLREDIGNLVVIDIGGATTDVHSVTEDTPGVKQVLINPEPVAKRTVEGDLGVFINAPHVFKLIEETRKNGYEYKEVKAIPGNEKERGFVRLLAETAALTAIKRHAGRLRDFFGPQGRQTVAEGKDLSGVRWVIGTGGALTRLGRGDEVLTRVIEYRGSRLFPPEDAKILIDRNYIMAAMGILSEKYPDKALRLLKESLGLDIED
ncbi:GlmL-related ornithine degradation protein [Halothermothrix orenii]|uniref:DNA mismatch repair protein MutL n=1 Tax=Halothermothrix orenii (strain H 168 / OCM 544 / DSM 9562) TaxID=373903 RepID=B8D002_HALOH|nr:GlmL-related ornithine degradation protein [Halothermothrix orenii]ACL70854.1 DNA mismatch repair protein MutL [Halothermothrix orenii H 168]